MEEEFKINPDLRTEMTALINSENFYRLNEDGQKAVINAMNEAQEKEGGIMGKLFGTNKDNAAMHIAFSICILLIVVGIICMATGNDQWSVIITGIMTTVGYIFGHGIKN